MKKRLINPTYSYQHGGSITIGATLEILDDNGVTVLESFTLSTNQPIANIDDAAQSLKNGFQDYIDTYKEMAKKVLPMFPGATSFNDAAAMFIRSIDEQVKI
jgi:hypothetical protein